MTESQFYLVVLLLVFLAYQVSQTRLESRQRFLTQRADAERANLDAEIVRLCPNLGHGLALHKLRTWQGVILEKNEYFRKRERSLLNPISDEPSTWFEIYSAFSEHAVDEEEEPNFPMPTKATEAEAKFLADAKEATERFIEAAREKRVLTGPEIEFLAYWQWRENLLTDGETWQRPSSMLAYFVSSVLESTLDRYARSL